MAHLNVLFFAPRYVASRFQFFALPFYLLPKKNVSLRVKKQIAMEYARYATGLGIFLGTAAALGSLLFDDDDDDKPTVEFDYAFKRRAMVFPFGLHLEDSEVDAKLEEKLVKAGASLLHHMITSAIDYHEAGLLETDAMKSELTSYEEDNDSIALFMEEMIFETEASTDFIESGDMLEKYNDWAKKNALPSMKRQEFSQKMKIKGHVSEKVGHANRKGYRQMVWVGDGPVPHGY